MHHFLVKDKIKLYLFKKKFLKSFNLLNKSLIFLKKVFNLLKKILIFLKSLIFIKKI